MAGLYLGGKVVAPVVTKEVPEERFGLTLGNFIGDIDSDGNLVAPNEIITFNGRGIKTIGDYGLYYKFYSDRSISSVDLSDLEEIIGDCALDNLTNYTQKLEDVNLRNLKKISGAYACRNVCYNVSSAKLKNTPFSKLQMIEGTSACYGACCYQRNLTNTGLSNLVSISGSSVCAYMYYGCSSLLNIELDNLTAISGNNACQYMYHGCSSLLNIELDNLTTISGSGACQYMFSNCTSLTRADFPSLISIDNINAFGTTSSNCIFENCTNLTEIHFRADAQTLIESLTGYQYLFGATNATIYFDL